MSSTIVRQQIIDLMKTRFAAILSAGGYYSNMGQRVTEWRTSPNDKGEGDGLDIRDYLDEQKPDAEDESLTLHRLHVALNIFCKNASAGAEVRKRIADVEKAIKVDATWNQLALRTEPANNSAGVEQNELTIGAATVFIVVEYLTDIFAEA